MLNCQAQNLCLKNTITSISFEGNKKTRAQILFREIEFELGDSFNKNLLDSLVEKSENNLFNTTLFNEVKIETKEIANCEIEVKVKLKERWYLWPSPHFDIIDRNFNIWWRDYNHDLQRTIYGFHLDYFNATGNNDKLRLKALFGWKQNFLFEYNTPYLDKSKTLRIKPRVEFTSKRNLIYSSINNKEQFLNSDEIVWKKFKSGITISKRVGFDIFHTLEMNYQQRSITDTVAVLNPNYLGSSNYELNYLELYYKLQFLKTDIDYYPTKGSIIEIDFLKRGFGVFTNVAQTRMKANIAQYFKLNNQFSLVSNARIQYNFNNEIPWIFREALGSGDNTIRGYELFLFNGLNSFMFRNALRYNLLSFKLKNKFISLKQLNDIPVAIYLKGFSEFGKVWDQELAVNNFLNNRWLKGNGFGIDIVTFYDLVLGIECNFNTINQNNFILQFNYKY